MRSMLVKKMLIAHIPLEIFNFTHIKHLHSKSSAILIDDKYRKQYCTQVLSSWCILNSEFPQV